MTTPTQVRTQLIASGFVPIPVAGKVPALERWEQRAETSQEDLDVWRKKFPAASNTGILCERSPVLDIDILDVAASDAAIKFVRERFGNLGKIILRYGRRPKCAIPFRTDTPFAKVQIGLIAPGGSTGQKIEILARGQQCVVHGIHPDTREPYVWTDGNPGSIKRADLPLIDGAAAQALVEGITDLLVREHGYRRVESAARGGDGHGNGADSWGDLYANILAGHDLHDSLRDLAARLVASGMAAGAAVNTLYGLMDRSEAPHDKRWRERRREIPRLVDSGLQLLRENRQREEDAAIDAAAERDGAPLFDDVQKYLGRFICYPSEYAAIAHVLWIAHTHLMPAWESTPRLAFLSAEPESGKTRCLEATEPLVPRPINTMNSSASYLFRKCGSDEGQPTVLFDEIDTIFGPKAKEHEDIRAHINSGHRRGAKFGRCVIRGSAVATEEIESYAAVALAGLGWLPDTILTRSIVIRMRRRRRVDRVEPFRHRIHNPEGTALCRRLIGWARKVAGDAEKARPVMPPSVEDRQADGWEPLIAVADLAGGKWPEAARKAAEALVAVNRETPVSLNLRLLADLRTVFFNNLLAVSQAKPKGLPTKRILEDLYTLDEAPWHTINKGEAYTPSQLAFHLRDYEVRPDLIREHPGQTTTQIRGYKIADLADAWRRYLQPLSLSRQAVTDVTDVTRETLNQFFEWVEEPEKSETDDPVTPVTPVTPNSETERGPALSPELHPSRIRQLADWYRKQAKALRAEMSPAILVAHLNKCLRETLANELAPDAIDRGVRRVVRASKRPTRAGNNPKKGSSRSSRSRP
jgi:hypothetical protein